MLAKHCRDRVEMIEKYDAAHLKEVLDASAINVRKKTAQEGSGGNPPRRAGDAVLACSKRERNRLYSLCLRPFAPYRWADAGVAELVDASDLSH